MNLLTKLKLRLRYRRAFGDQDVLAVKSPEMARMEAALWDDVDPGFAALLRSIADDGKWPDEIPDGHGRCLRCGLVVATEVSGSGMVKTAPHFGCVGSLVDPEASDG